MLKVTKPEIEAVLVSSNGEEMDTPPEKTFKAVHVLEADLEATPFAPQLILMKPFEAVFDTTKLLPSKDREDT